MGKEKSLKAKNYYYFKIIGVVLGLLLSVQLFQNCSAIMAPENDETSSKAPSNISTPASHPNDEMIKPTSQKPILANREYINELLSEVFETPETAGSAAGLIRTWVYTQSGIFGYPCNPKGSLGTGDCGGTLLASMNPAADTLRASHKSQLCLSLTGNPTFLQNALMKIDNRPATPDISSLQQLVKLFYRGEDDVLSVANGLLQVDKNLKIEDPTITDIDRWRLLTNMVCESPNWELL